METVKQNMVGSLATAAGILVLLIAIFVPAIKGRLLEQMIVIAWGLPLGGWTIQAYIEKNWKLSLVGFGFAALLFLAG